MKSDPAHVATDAEIAKIEKLITKEYKKAHKEVSKKLDDYLARFAAKDEKWQEWVANGTKTKKEYKEWRKGQILVGKRWKDMRDSLATDYTNAAKITQSITKSFAPGVYAINHNYATFQVEKNALVDTSYSLYSRESVEYMYKGKPKLYHTYGKAVAKEIKEGKQYAWDRRRITSVLTQAILQGESIPAVTKRLEQVTVGDHKAAIRNARTMMTGVQNAGRIDAFERAKSKGIPVRKQWLATLDSRTRHWHRELDGVIVDNDEPFENEFGKIMFPGDPEAAPANVYNCRCTLLASIKGFEIDTTNTDLRHDEHLGGLTYEEWLAEKKSTSNPIDLPEKKAANIKGAWFGKYGGSKSGGSGSKEYSGTKTSKGTDTAWRLTESKYKNVETVAEAEQYAKNAFVEGGGFNLTGKAVSFKGIDVDTANRINQRLTSIYEQFDLTKLSSLESFGKANKKVFSKHSDAPFITTNFGNIGINNTIVKNAKELEKYNDRGRKSFQYVMDNIDKLTGEQKQIALAYRKAGKSLVGDSLEDMITHEVGHHISYMPRVNSRLGEIQKSTDWRKTAERLSGYANHSFGEYVAESFTAYCRGERDKLQPELIQLFDNLRR